MRKLSLILLLLCGCNGPPSPFYYYVNTEHSGGHITQVSVRLPEGEIIALNNQPRTQELIACLKNVSTDLSSAKNFSGSTAKQSKLYYCLDIQRSGGLVMSVRVKMPKYRDSDVIVIKDQASRDELLAALSQIIADLETVKNQFQFQPEKLIP